MLGGLPMALANPGMGRPPSLISGRGGQPVAEKWGGAEGGPLGPSGFSEGPQKEGAQRVWVQVFKRTQQGAQKNPNRTQNIEAKDGPSELNTSDVWDPRPEETEQSRQ